MAPRAVPDDRIPTDAGPVRGPGRRRRHHWSALAAVLTLLTGGALVVPTITAGAAGPHWWPSAAAARPSTPPTVGTPWPVPAPSAGTFRAAPESFDPATVLRVPGTVVARGDGRMVFAGGRGPVLGKSGPLRRFRVAVERVSGEDVGDFAAQVQATLGNTRSWIAGGVRLQRVSGADAAEFTVYLATRDTAQKMCMAGGVNLQVRGVPYTSCRTAGRVVINLDRWLTSAPTFHRHGVSLAVYRHYVINHEVGHQLGHRHEGCPRRGGQAPVMVQQTLTLRGCTPDPWPYRGGKRYAGPAR